MRMRPETTAIALLGSWPLWNSPTEVAPARPAVARPALPSSRWDSASVASPEAQRASQLLAKVGRQWRESEAFVAATIPQGDFIFDMVAPETLALAPPIAEYDVTYDLDWDHEEHPTLDVDDVDLEIITLQAANV